MPNPLKPLLSRPRYMLENFRRSLAYIDALPQLTLLGALVGLATGVLIVGFRLLMEAPLAWYVPGGAGNFEALAPHHRALLIIGGATLVCALMMSAKRYRDVGVAHVLDRLHNHQGYLPWRNTVLQFVAAILSMVSGQSVGREGPAVHIGAGTASLVGQRLRLPNNSLQTLIACGAAAAIAASFDTPMAGVIFAMEVVLMEYTVVGFMPVILSSVIGAALSQAVFGEAAAISVNSSHMSSLFELPYMAFGGLVIATAAAGFIYLNLWGRRRNHWPMPVRFLLAALLTAAIAWPVPEIMGQGYDTLNAALNSQLALTALITIAAAKLVSSALATGLGIPGGIIGPSLVTGACIGGMLGLLAQHFELGFAEPSFYVTLGMAAMMAAVVNAPLAALVAVLELSYNPNIIFPTMLMIVFATVTTRSVFNMEGIFAEQLKISGRPVQFRPAQQALRRAGVMSIADSRFASAPRRLNYDEAKNLLSGTPQWLVIETEKKSLLLQAVDLAAFMEEAPVEVLSLEQDIDLLDIPARRRVLAPIHPTANLLEALQALRAEGTDALYVTRPNTPLTSPIQGIVTREAIDNYYQP